MKSKTRPTPFLWRPGEGCDVDALARLRRAFRRPGAPMGEAWFMGETRRMYWDLLGNLTTLPIEDIQTPLFEIASGTQAFGELDEWTEWFHHILAETLPRAHENYAFHSYIEHLITTFMALYPDGVTQEPCKGFRRDVLDTLGRAMMNAECWEENRIRVGAVLCREYNPRVGCWFWFNASGDFSASMFFCLKYLDTQEIDGWLRSVFAIPDRYWRAQVMVWFVGAHALLAGDVPDPSKYDLTDHPCIDWEAAHLLKYYPPKEFVPRANRAAALAAVGAIMNDDIYLEWALSIAEDKDLESELAELPEMFRAIYLLGWTP